MILYFADRQMNIIGHASTTLPGGRVIREDLKSEEVETGVATFSCFIGFTDKTRAEVEAMASAGNYLLRSQDSENEFYTIIDSEIDTKNREVYIYAEDAGLDLINEIVGEYEATEAHNAEWYVNKYITDSGFEIGINEIPADRSLKLSWEGESTVTERLASIATQFGGFEVSYSYEIKGLEITKKYINIFEQRGKDEGVQLRLDRNIDRIVTSKSVANLATAFLCEGGVPDNAETPITFTSENYSYDDGDFFVDGDKLKSRKANEKWSRYVWNKEPNKEGEDGGYIVRPYSYNTTNPETLKSHAITELKKVCDMEINYEIDINRLPDGVKIGDRVNIVDDAGELYVSTRVLLLETSVCDRKYKATLGEHIIKKSGIAQKVADLASEFAKNSQSAARAYEIAKNAAQKANEAKDAAQKAANDAYSADQMANAAFGRADEAVNAAQTASNDALLAAGKVDDIVETVTEMDETVKAAGAAAEEAKGASEEAKGLAQEAKDKADEAHAYYEEVKTEYPKVKEAAEKATAAAEEATGAASEATDFAERAKSVADAAKLDAEQAKKDIAEFGNELETTVDTLKAEYARKTDLTETAASLSSEIRRSAALISSVVSGRTVIDETANGAQDLAAAAWAKVQKAIELADAASVAAREAQQVYDELQADADAAQAAADKANEAVTEAQGLLDTARANLAQAEANLKAVLERADATEEDIAEAERAVADAETSAATAKTAADNAKAEAIKARNAADAAYIAAEKALGEANAASDYATYAATMANEYYATYDAQKTADDASTAAGNAADVANQAVTDAKNAWDRAGNALYAAEQAAIDADNAAANLAAANKRLSTARAQLETILNNATATEEEIADARAKVESAQAAVDAAKEDAAAASAAARLAKELADSAKADAEEAQKAADKAQKAADDAYNKADEAQKAVDGLSVTVAHMQTQITQTQEQIALKAEKTEVTETNKKVTAVETTATDAYDQASAALSTAQTAQVTANGANTAANNAQTAAADAQTAANNAQTAADNAQGTADDAKAKAEAAQGDIAKLDVRVSKNEADLKVANDQIASKVSRTELQLLEVGGKNMIRGLLDGAGWLEYSFFNEEEHGFEKIYLAAEPKYIFCGNAFSLTPGQKYTLSFTAKLSGYMESPSLHIVTGGVDGDAIYGVVLDTLTGTYARFVKTFTAEGNAEDLASCYLKINVTEPPDWYEGSEPGCLYIKDIQLEKGDKATDWGFAPEDLVDALDDMVVGGRNLIPKSKMGENLVDISDYSISKYGYVCPGNITDNYYVFGQTGELNLKANTKYTVSFTCWLDTTDTHAKQQLTWDFLPDNLPQKFFEATATPTRHKYTVWSYSSDMATAKLRFFVYEKDSEGYFSKYPIYVTDIKIEEGTKATSWTAAPEDILEEVGALKHDAGNLIKDFANAQSDIVELADQISAIVADGDGATGLKQDSTGAWFFDLSDIDNKFVLADQKAAELEGIVLDDKGRIDALRSDADALKYLTAYIKQGTDEENNPILELGNGDEKGEDGSSKFKVKITNKSIRLEESGYAPAEIDREAIIIEKAKLRGELEIGVDADDGIDGVWVWKRRNNGNLGLTWKGVE